MAPIRLALVFASIAWLTEPAVPAPRTGSVDPAAPKPRPPQMPAGAHILAGDKIAAMLGQCSRDTPPPGEGHWTPDAQSVIALERALPDALAQQHRSRLRSIFPQHLARQYVGIVRKGRRYLYGNFAPADFLPRRPNRDVMMVCDGGESFFGVEYDVAAGRISHLAFNGVT